MRVCILSNCLDIRPGITQLTDLQLKGPPEPRGLEVMSRRQNNLQYVQEEPAFLRRLKEGFKQDDDKVEEKRSRREFEEIIDQDEAPQVVIEDKDKDRIAADEARAYVVAKEGVKLSENKNGTTNTNAPKSGIPEANIPSKPKVENVSLGIRRAKKLNEGVKRIHEDDKDNTPITEKPRKSAPRKEKKLKLSFEEDE